MRSVVVYSLLRILAFAVPFGVLMLFPAFQDLPWLAAVFAAVIGLALSMLFLRRPLDAVSAGLSERRTTRRVERDDTAVEDEADDALRAAAGPVAGPVNPIEAEGGPDAPGPADSDPQAPADPAIGDHPTKAQESSPA